MAVERSVGVWVHPARPEALEAAAEFIRGISAHGIVCYLEPYRMEAIASLTPGIELRILGADTDVDLEMLTVFGGDGTILSAAAWAHPRGVPLLGVNLGHVGFLAELEAHETNSLVDQIVARDYQVEERLTLDVVVLDKIGTVMWRSFAINEMSLEKNARGHMIEASVRVDEDDLSAWSCDGVLVSTPTGSTAYAFSAGGPVIWPDVFAIELVPLLAHALFAKPMVLSPNSVIVLELTGEGQDGALVLCDGRREMAIEPDWKVRVTKHDTNLRLARLVKQPFTTRLVQKFELPTHSWRGGA
ncbi:MAG: NAD kinase [Propionibacteriaceae bacterium]|jgi:NAD+ kinase|nr:NAD kinase [Propionibacteriaceae bacterium]